MFRRIWTVLAAAWVSAWIAGLLFKLLGLDNTLGLILTLAVGALGGWAALDEARSVEPWTLWDERDAYLGWITFFGVVAVIGCFFLPMPAGGIAAGAVAAVTIVVLRRVPPAAASAAGPHGRLATRSLPLTPTGPS